VGQVANNPPTTIQTMSAECQALGPLCFLMMREGFIFFKLFFCPHDQNAVSDQKIMVGRKVVKYFVIEVEQNA
jgi:hypothetical protein